MAASVSNSIFSKKSVFIITGATRGLGRTIVLQMSDKSIRGSLFILLSRNKDLLTEVGELVERKEGIHAVTAVFDQGSAKQDDFDVVLENCMSVVNAQPSQFEQAVIVHNAGTLEPIDFVRDLDKVGPISSYLQINLVGCVVLTSKFLQLFNSNVVGTRVVINISSLAAVAPIKTWGLYCMAKAAREMMVQVVSTEEGNTVRTLSYAPGPLYTDMNKTALQNSKDTELKSMLEDLVSNKKYVECDDTVRKLVTILEENSFDNGCHIDYFDK